MTVFTQRLAAAANDAIERSDGTNFTTDPVAALGAGLVYGRSGAGGSPFWYSGFLFSNVTIDQGETISAAKISFTAKSNFSMTAGITVAVYANAVDSAANFTSDADVASRALSTATVNWSAPNTGTTDVAVDTVDFASVVQEMVDRAGWASGNSIMILFRETAGTAGESADYYFYEDSTTKCAEISITHTSSTAYSMDAAVGAFTLTGVAATLNKSLNMVASVGAFTLTGVAAALTRGYVLVANTGAFVLTGISATLNRALIMAASTGSFTLTGVAATFTRGYTLVASVGSFVLTGIAAIFPLWYTARTKNTASYTPRTKNTATYNARTKNTASYTERNRSN